MGRNHIPAPLFLSRRDCTNLCTVPTGQLGRGEYDCYQHTVPKGTRTALHDQINDMPFINPLILFFGIYGQPLLAKIGGGD
jgi:hypothetical protein